MELEHVVVDEVDLRDALRGEVDAAAPGYEHGGAAMFSGLHTMSAGAARGRAILRQGTGWETSCSNEGAQRTRKRAYLMAWQALERC